MSDIDEIFGKMAEAKGSSSGTFLTTGVYTVALKAVEWIPDGFKGTSCKFHLSIIKSSDEVNHPVGQTRVWILKFDKKEQRERALADIKAFYFALCGFDPRALKSPESNPQAHAEVTKLFKAMIDPTFAAANKYEEKAAMMLGRQCVAEVEVIATKPKPNDPSGKPGQYTRHTYGPLPKAA